MRGTKIMIVEDEGIIGEDLRTSLEQTGYEVLSVVASGEEAITEVEKQNPDLILMDIVLKGHIDGIETASRIKKHMEVPVVFLSAFDDEDKLERAKQSAAYGYLLKPFSDKLLHTTITMALHKHGLESRLKENEKRYRSILEQIQEGYFEIDLDGRFVFFNEAMSRIVSRTGDDLQQMKIQTLMGPEAESAFSQTRDEIAATGNPVLNFIFELEQKNRHNRYIDLSIMPIIDDSDGLKGYRGLARDITDKKKMDIKLIQTPAFLQNVLDSSIDGISTTDLKGEIVYATPRLEEMIGDDLSHMVGQNVSRYYKNGIEDAKYIMKQLWTEGELKNHEMQFVRKDGKVIDAILSATLLKDASQQVVGTLGIFKDITDKKRLEEQIVQAQKWESVGVLAGGVAHDFNNLLTAILGNITLAQMYSKPEGKVYQLLTESEKACSKAKDLTDRLTAFSRRGDVPPKKIGDITTTIKEVAGFVLMGSNVTGDFQLQKNLWAIEYDIDLIKQMITDIVTNAKEAMPKGGKLEIVSQNMTLTGRTAGAVPKMRAGKYIKIIFQDHGIGILKEHLSKVFDPYFSTKEIGVQKGMGLGLASVYSIVKKHGGHIQVESTDESGTTISLYLPAIEQKPIGRPTAAVKPLAGQSSKGAILVMDDEEMVREVIGEMLKRLGYVVKFAHNGSEAVELYDKAKETRAPFYAVILDITIRGGMGGKETMKRLREIDPEVRAYASSGYTEDPAMTDFKKYGFTGAISKPYGMENLVKILGGTLNGPGSGGG